jgi:hypothetical protein
MNAISAIPVFGLTATAADYKVADNTGAQAMTWQWIKRHNIRKIEKKASSQELGKYMLQVKREDKEEVSDFLDGLFSQIPELEGQPANFHGLNAAVMPALCSVEQRDSDLKISFLLSLSLCLIVEEAQRKIIDFFYNFPWPGNCFPLYDKNSVPALLWYFWIYFPSPQWLDGLVYNDQIGFSHLAEHFVH